MKPSKTNTLSTSSQKGEIVLYQPDESSVYSILEHTAVDVINDISYQI